VFAFHRELQLTPAVLRTINVRQVGLLKSTFEALDIDPSVARVESMPDGRRGGFLAIRAAQARQFAHQLRERGVFVDARGDILRFGPAPYLREDQLRDSMAAFGELLTP
jgi:kynureninase